MRVRIIRLSNQRVNIRKFGRRVCFKWGHSISMVRRCLSFWTFLVDVRWGFELWGFVKARGFDGGVVKGAV